MTEQSIETKLHEGTRRLEEFGVVNKSWIPTVMSKYEYLIQRGQDVALNTLFNATNPMTKELYTYGELGDMLLENATLNPVDPISIPIQISVDGQIQEGYISLPSEIALKQFDPYDTYAPKSLEMILTGLNYIANPNAPEQVPIRKAIAARRFNRELIANGVIIEWTDGIVETAYNTVIAEGRVSYKSIAGALIDAGHFETNYFYDQNGNPIPDRIDKISGLVRKLRENYDDIPEPIRFTKWQEIIVDDRKLEIGRRTIISDANINYKNIALALVENGEFPMEYFFDSDGNVTGNIRAITVLVRKLREIYDDIPKPIEFTQWENVDGSWEGIAEDLANKLDHISLKSFIIKGRGSDIINTIVSEYILTNLGIDIAGKSIRKYFGPMKLEPNHPFWQSLASQVGIDPSLILSEYSVKQKINWEDTEVLKLVDEAFGIYGNGNGVGIEEKQAMLEIYGSGREISNILYELLVESGYPITNSNAARGYITRLKKMKV